MFPMRSRIASFLTLLACAGLVPALESCGSEVVKGADGDHRSRVTSNTAATPFATAKAAAAVPRAAPVTDALHFDLYCQVHGRIIAEGDPEAVHGTYPANVPAWDDHPHFTLDLHAMLVCEWGGCEGYGPSQIASATADRITLDNRPGLKIFIRRRDWHYEQRQEDMGRIAVTRGQCRRADFSGFPEVPQPAAPTH
jgi:hypothetical protein